MTSTYLAGVFLTICTYEGPQLVYHFYDATVASSHEDTDESSDGEIEWSEDNESESDDETDQIAHYRRFSAGNRSTVSDVVSQGIGFTSKPGSPLTVRNNNTTPSARHISVSSTDSDARGVNQNATTSVSFNFPSKQSTSAKAESPSSVSVPKSIVTIASNNNNGALTGNSLLTNTSNIPLPTEKPTDADSTVSTISTTRSSKAYQAELPCGLDKEILAEILSPPESMCNEKFSLSVEDCIFVGIPVHILESGTWRRLKEDAGKSHATQGGSNELHHAGQEASAAINSDSAVVSSTVDNFNDETHSDVTGSSKSVDSTEQDDKSRTSKSDADGIGSSRIQGVITEKDSPMRMFHVSFALVPPITEAAVCEERVYRYILVPFVRMLRQEQASKNYVWNEIVKMQRACERLGASTAAQKQEAMEACSELARALRQMCGAITKMDIARIMIGQKPRAFQVPLQLELSQLPDWNDEVSPHAYVSTINLVSKEIGNDCFECYGLLLLDDAEVIVQEIEVDPQGPVAAMIRNIEPTSSLQELARNNSIDIKQLVKLVWSLVYWRRARIIVPIHAQYTYGVSPLSVTGSRYYELSRAYHHLFPMMPPMQKLMALLSTGKPKPFSMHIPSTDHRNIYLKTIAWMLQKDLVVHLQTFALIVVTRKIKLSSMNVSERKIQDPPADHNSAAQMQTSHISDQARPAAPEVLDPSRRWKWMSRRKSASRLELEENEDTIIQDPRSASPLEKQWLGQVAVSGLTRNPDLAALFQRLTKYFNGKDCLEQVMIRERVSRDEMRRFLNEFNPYILTYKHF